MEKVITSRNTSINKDKVPAIYSTLAKHGYYGTHIFDVGCGKYTRHIKEFAKENCICTYWHGFDPYNQSEGHNDKVRMIAFDERYAGEKNPNMFVSSNVLNVINGSNRQREYLHSIFRMMKDIDECYITVYEGNRSGIGRITKKDCWQENKKINEYLELVITAYRDTHTSSYMDEGKLPPHSIDIKYGMIRIYPNYGK